MSLGYCVCGEKILDGNPSVCRKCHARFFWVDRSKPEKEQPRDIAALNMQEGGSHYKSMKIQPVEYIHANNLGYCEGAVIKYISRWRNKNGLEDLRKAKHFIDLLIELETKDDRDTTGQAV